jgi:hypothetical protein
MRKRRLSAPGQLLLHFPEDHRDDPRQRPRIDAARTVLRRLDAMSETPERKRLETLITTGQLLPGTEVENISVIKFIRDRREALKKFVEIIALAEFARDRAHQDAACALLKEFDDLDEVPLALKLKELGLCDSTTSFGRPIGNWRYTLFGFRRAMKKWEEEQENT